MAGERTFYFTCRSVGRIARTSRLLELSMWNLVRRYIGNKYLGLFVNGGRVIEEVIQERVAL